MAAAGGATHAVLAAVALASAAALLVPPPATRAGDEPLPLPASSQVVAADLDRDGVREFVTLTEASSGRAAIERLAHVGGEWRPAGANAVVARPGSSSGEVAVGLLVVREGTRDRLLLLSSLASEDRTGTRCCLELWDVGLDASGLALTLLAGTAPVAEEAERLDVDGDGVDELLVSGLRYSSTGDAQPNVVVLRRTPDGYAPILESSGWEIVDPIVLDADGRPGDELVWVRGTDLHRVAWVEGRRVDERSPHPLAGAPIGVVAGPVLVAWNGAELVTLRWPAGAPAEEVGRRRQEEHRAVFGLPGGGGDGSFVIVPPPFDRGAGAPPIEILDESLRTVETVPIPAELGSYLELIDRDAEGRIGRVLEAGRNVWPWFGHVPMPDRRPAVAAFGWLIRPEAGGGHEISRVSPFVGRQPLAIAGPDDGWMAVGTEWASGPDHVWLWPGPWSDQGSGMALVPVAHILEPAGPVAFDLGAAVDVGEKAGTRIVVAPATGFEIQSEVQPGSELLWSAGRDGPWHAAAARDGRVRLRVLPGPVAGEPAGQGAAGGFERAAVVIHPAGHVQVERWSGAFVDEPPLVAATGTTAWLAGSATVEGTARSVAPITVTVDGAEVATGAGGAFRTAVEAGLWPRQVEIVAVDVLGGRAAITTAVVGYADYRLLPWPALAAAGLLGIGGTMFLRVPRGRTVSLPTADADARIEDVDERGPMARPDDRVGTDFGLESATSLEDDEEGAR